MAKNRGYSPSEDSRCLCPHTPQWKKRLARKDPGERAVLLLAAAYRALEAQHLLEAIQQNFLWPGGSYRRMTARAAAAVRHLRTSHPYFPPLDDPDEPEDTDQPPGDG
jgi:hypothetical protein